MSERLYGDRLANLKPVDKQTAISVYGKGEQPLKISTTDSYSEQPFPIIKSPKVTGDFTGKVFGSLTVLGYYGKKSRLIERSNTEKRTTAFWVCRCSCGSYQLVRRKTLLAGTRQECEVCHKKKYIRGEQQ